MTDPPADVVAEDGKRRGTEVASEVRGVPHGTARKVELPKLFFGFQEALRDHQQGVQDKTAGHAGNTRESRLRGR